MKNILDYNFPEDIKNMSNDELKNLSEEIRKFLIENVSKTGGHIASNLGVVELTLALHKVFDSPDDKIIFDVGHQSYVHKILTGRAKDFTSLRKFGGLSGFPKRRESIHDHFDTGHSSTSLSYAYGMAKARDIKGKSYNVIPIIGDGSMTGGEAFEALNNIGATKTNVIIILNDNEMSISKNVGGLSKHLTKLRTSKNYLNIKSFVKNTISTIPKIGEPISEGLRAIKNNIKFSILRNEGDMFEELGITYLGPVDGHNFDDLLDNLKNAKSLNEPVIVHVITKKGKGYSYAEANPSKFHGIGPFEIATGETLSKSKITFSQVAGNYIFEKAKENEKIVAVTAAMGDAVGLNDFSKEFPNRYFDVGIAEQHAVTFSAGLANSNLKPFVFIYSSFLQRGFDQIIEDVCLQKLPVTFMIDRAGIVGQDGETHHGIFDLSYLNLIPNLTIFTPFDKNSLEESIEKALIIDGPVAIRYPRGECLNEFENKMCSNTPQVLIYSCGRMHYLGNELVEYLNNFNISSSNIDFTCIKPISLPDIKAEVICTLEDNSIVGGFGSIINDKYINSNIKLLNFGWPDKFIEHGSIKELENKYGLTKEEIAKKIIECLKK